MSDTPFTDSCTYGFTDEDGIHCESVHADVARTLERERDEALHDATQQTIKVSLIKSRWIAARQALESIVEGTRCRECDGEDQARLAREGLEASK